MSFLDSWSPRLLAFLRVIAGLMFFEHGCMKLLHFPAPMMPGPLPPLLMAAGVIELVAGALIVLGLFTKPAAFIASGETAVAYFGFHSLNAFHMMPPATPVSFDPQVNHGAEAALYAVIFLYLAAAGPGAFALDSLLGKRRGLEAASA
ncbi:MAG TPA: DoxX family protein [Caulobacteraceae bacterium]|nr:DoxX family protein [Caulobacteraceae bacterium]